jgi:tetratricopeptide (TPR) repeat protein
MPGLERQRLLLLGRAGDSRVASYLPSLDEELLLRAREAFEAGETDRAGKLLDAAEDQTDPTWNLLRGQVFLSQTRYEEAAACLHKAEERYPKETTFRLEHCYRELGDYKRAYEYACKQRR